MHPMGVAAIDDPSPETVAAAAQLNRFSDFAGVSLVVACVFWRNTFAATPEAQRWPEYVRWAVANSEAICNGRIE